MVGINFFLRRIRKNLPQNDQANRYSWRMRRRRRKKEEEEEETDEEEEEKEAEEAEDEEEEEKEKEEEEEETEEEEEEETEEEEAITKSVSLWSEVIWTNSPPGPCAVRVQIPLVVTVSVTSVSPHTLHHQLCDEGGDGHHVTRHKEDQHATQHHHTKGSQPHSTDTAVVHTHLGARVG